jgi:hypothetical protein
MEQQLLLFTDAEEEEEEEEQECDNCSKNFEIISQAYIEKMETIESEGRVNAPISMVRQHRGDLIAYETDYERVRSSPGEWCILEAYGSGWSSWYLYNYQNTHLMIIIKTSSDNYECQYAPSREKFELIVRDNV